MKWRLAGFGHPGRRVSSRGLGEFDDTIPIVNPLELPTGQHDRKQLFRMWAGYNGPVVYIWADHFEDAFEELQEYLDDNAPGVFTLLTEQDYRDAAADLKLAWKPHWPDPDDVDFERVTQAAEADLTMVGGHTTFKVARQPGVWGVFLPSDEWGGGDVDDCEELLGVWKASAVAYVEQYDEDPEPPEAIEDCAKEVGEELFQKPSVTPKRGMRIDTSIDGLGSAFRNPLWTKIPRSAAVRFKKYVRIPGTTERLFMTIQGRNSGTLTQASMYSPFVVVHRPTGAPVRVYEVNAARPSDVRVHEAAAFAEALIASGVLEIV
jgi:hypothetical protein